MHKYRVVDCRADQNRLLLEGGVGRYHWARVLKEPPRVGDLLHGSRPHLGFGLLRCARTTLTFRVIFESINSVDARFETVWMAEPMSTTRPGCASADPW